MKKFVYSVFISFWASVATIAILNGVAPKASADIESAETAYTLAEVAEHNTLDDCWMAIEGQVYDFSEYIEQHPTPPAVLEPWCGKEATEGMRTKGYGRDHSDRAWQMAKAYRVGNLAD